MRNNSKSGNPKNPFKNNGSKPNSKTTGKRVGKSKLEKSNNQLNKRVKK